MLDKCKMIDSGVEWIGDIPQSWSVFPAGGVFSEVKEKNTNNEYSNAFSFRYGEIVDKKTNGVENESIEETLSAYRVVSPDTIMINGLNLNYDFITQRVAIVKERGIITSAYLAVQPNKERIVPKFAVYLFKAYDAKQVFHGMGSGIRKTLKYSDFKNIKIIAPSLDEQQHIVAYLDCKMQEIDQLISEAKASIEEYKAWKDSIICEAVTKGLDPDVEMKDSGIEWIGCIPTHWKLTSLKRICRKIKDGSHFSPEVTNEGYPYVTAGDIHGKGIVYSQCRTISVEDYEALEKMGCRPSKGDVLLVKDGATTGRVGLMTDNQKCVLLSSVAMLTAGSNISNEYLMRLIESEVLQFQIRKSMAGSAMPRTTLSKLQSYIAIDCPYDEQIQITRYLDTKCAMIDEVIAEKEALITDLEAYKKSLIFEVVTGKRKVV